MHLNIADKFHKNIRGVAFSLIGLLVILLFYLAYVQIVQENFLVNHPLNHRTMELAAKTQHGTIVDRHGEKLAVSIPDDSGGFKRKYPYGPITGHIVGYDSSKYGKTGIESTYAGDLTGLNNPLRHLGPITSLWKTQPGNNISLTIDARLQEASYKALGNKRGAVVAISPRTGAILAMVSKPDFDPNTIDQTWDAVSHAADSPLLNRPLQGLYPPGSTMKVMIAEAALTEKIADRNRTFNCDGALKIGPDYVLTESNHQVHGRINLEEALAVSCNITFGTLSLELGRNRMEKTFERYGFHRSIGDDLQEQASILPDFSRLSDGDLAQTGIGQGGLLVTPIRMAMLASSFANKGIIMQPYLVNQIIAPDGAVIKQFKPKEWLQTSTPQLADSIRNMMITEVNTGTGSAARLSDIPVAGKTGTAENPHGASHAWFIGFAPADNPQIAIAVIVENGGSGGGIAAPIARQIFAQALR